MLLAVWYDICRSVCIVRCSLFAVVCCCVLLVGCCLLLLFVVVCCLLVVAVWFGVLCVW